MQRKGLSSTLVMKFGGASVATPGHFAQIAKIICERTKSYSRIAVVVSAMGKATDELLALSRIVNPNPPRRELDMLISVGERVSIALLAMALSYEKKEAVSFTGSQSGVITNNTHAEAFIVEMRPHRLLRKLEEEKIVIVAGFQGVSREGEITTLGRGGGDVSAVAIAAALHAEKVEFYKDVSGIFSTDPKQDLQAQMFSSLNYEEAIAIALGGAKILQLRALLLAQKNGIPLHVLSFEEPNKVGTEIFSMGSERFLQPVYEEENECANNYAL